METTRDKQTKVKRTFEMDEYDKKILSIIEEHGHAVQGVGVDPDSQTPQFAYTVGRTEEGRPEFYIIGPLPLDVMKKILNEIVEVDKTTPIGPGEKVDHVLKGIPVKLVEVDPAKCEMFMATHFYGDHVTALQVLWPDENDRFPGDPGYSMPAHYQPVGGEEVDRDDDPDAA